MSMEVQVEDDSSSSSSSTSSSLTSAAAAAEPSPTRPTALCLTLLAPTRKRRFAGSQLSRINFGTNQNNVAGVLDDISPTSSTTSLNTLGLSSTSSSSGSEDESSSDEVLNDKRIRLSSSSSVSSQTSDANTINRSASVSPAPESSIYDLTDIECSQGSSKSRPYFKDTVIGDGEYELIGDGNECKAVHLKNRTIHHCRRMNQEEYTLFMLLAERIEMANKFLTRPQMAELRRMLMPQETRVISSERNTVFHVISPDHQCNLQTMFAMRNNQEKMSELQSRSIFIQVTRMVHYCQKVGVYFRDFMLKKIVFADKESSNIRFMFSPQDLHILPTLDSDLIELKKGCCPVYTAPEMIPPPNSRHHSYKAGPASVWSLGVLLFTLLTGRPPFVARCPKDLFRSIRISKVTFQPRDSATLPAKVLVQTLLRSQPHERPQARDILSFEWCREEYVETLEFCLQVRNPVVEVNVTADIESILNNPSTERNVLYSERPEQRFHMVNFMKRNIEKLNVRVVPEQQVPDIDLPDLMPDYLGLCSQR